SLRRHGPGRCRRTAHHGRRDICQESPAAPGPRAPAPAADYVWRAALCRGREPGVLRGGRARTLPALRCLGGQDPERRQAVRPPRGAGRQVLSGGQPQDGPGARSDAVSNVPCTGRRGDSMKATALLATLVLGIFLAPLVSEAQLPRTIPRIAFLALSPGPWPVCC